jgi:N-acetylglucosaminyl-diphospho-decaprenol L-rhamnosyltransferase
MTADAAVVIVSYNTGRLIDECLASLEAEKGALDQQVIVLDNASSDDSIERIGTHPEVTLIDAGENLGFGPGVNRAAAVADAEYLVLLNPDTVVLDHAIERLVAFARANPGHGLYGGRTVDRDGNLVGSSCWALPTVWSMTCFALGLTTFFRDHPRLDPEAIGGWQRDSVREVGIVTGCLLAIPMDLWCRLGGFDERYFMYGEDADLAFRVKAAGHRPIITPDAVVVHDVGQASATRADKLLLLHRGKATLLRDHFSGWRRRVVLTELLAGVGLRTVLASVGPGKRKPAAAGWREVWRHRRGWIGGYDDRRPSGESAEPRP